MRAGSFPFLAEALAQMAAPAVPGERPLCPQCGQGVTSSGFTSGGPCAVVYEGTVTLAVCPDCIKAVYGKIPSDHDPNAKPGPTPVNECVQLGPWAPAMWPMGSYRPAWLGELLAKQPMPFAASFTTKEAA